MFNLWAFKLQIYGLKWLYGRKVSSANNVRFCSRTHFPGINKQHPFSQTLTPPYHSVQPTLSHALIEKFSSHTHNLLPPDPAIPTHSPASKNHDLPLFPYINPTQYEDHLVPRGSYSLQRSDPLENLPSSIPITSKIPSLTNPKDKTERDRSRPQDKYPPPPPFAIQPQCRPTSPQ